MAKVDGAGGHHEGVPAVEIKGLVKWYGVYPALRGVDLCVGPGEILALFGPNGAGKSTLLRIVAGLVRPTAGSVRIDGLEVGRNNDGVRRIVGVLAHGHQLYETLTGRENLLFAATMLGLDRPAERVAGVLAKVGLEAAAEGRVRTFSSGMKRRLALAKLMLREPQVMLLDEPFTNLDIQAMKLLEEFLMVSKTTGVTTLLATHNLTMGCAVADRMAVLEQGRVVFDAPRNEVSQESLRSLFTIHGESWGVE
ncbi:MAG: heme ABC exporter ATP-binding protein CcmA [candidate division NC10 bacterium]|nr:heme ABC exporter ATP-binding protein CcmA [candidate division NC10 bacterium]MDE2322067.1 heme ABC exporter ATP-binding protein CcmA [candidate division NC10 bacterium]